MVYKYEYESFLLVWKQENKISEKSFTSESLSLIQTVPFVDYSVFLCVASEAMRGSTPLDVAASSVMDNNGLALALEEPDLEKVC